VSFVHSLAFAFVGFFLPVFFAGSRHYSGLQMGALYAAYNVCGILAAVPVGILADRHHPRWLLVGGLLLTLLAPTLILFDLGFAAAFVAMGALGMSLNMVRQVLDAVWYRGHVGDGARFGPYLAVRSGGTALGMVGAGLLVDVLGFHALLLGLAAAGAILVFPALGLPRAAVARFRLGDYGRDLANPRVLLFAVWVFLFASHWGGEGTCYALFLKQDLGLSMGGTGLYMAGELGALALASVVSARAIADEARAPALLVVGLVLSGLAQVAMVTPDVALSFAFRAVHGVGDGIVITTLYVTVGRLFRVERIGGNAGVVVFLTMLGATAGSVVYGPFGAAHGYGAALIVGGALTGSLAALLLVVAPPAVLRRPRPSGGPRRNER